MIRKPVVAGQFYPGDVDQLKNTLNELIIKIPENEKRNAILTMLPHAGYMYSGKVAGKTLSYVDLKENILLLGPNHTGIGHPFSVWYAGKWEFPLGHLNVNEKIADELIENVKYLTPDFSAHIREHSLEVLIPLLWYVKNNVQIIPICIMEPRLEILIDAGKKIAEVLHKMEDVSIVVSSDMSHFIPERQAKLLDKIAIDRCLKIDPEGLYNDVKRHNISMCGVLPMTVGLQIAKELGAKEGKLIQYSTSGDVTGDKSYVVGYAGIIIY